MKKKKQKKKTSKKTAKKKKDANQYIILGILLILILGIISFNLLSDYNKKAEAIVLKAECENCFDVTALLEGIKKLSGLNELNLREIEFDSKEGKEIIKKYSIKNAPALILKSINKEKLQSAAQIFDERDGAIVFDRSVPGIDLSTGKKTGEVKIIEINSSNCNQCRSLGEIKQILRGIGVYIKEYKNLRDNTLEGKKLIKEHNISILPSLIISKEIEDYWLISNELNRLFRKSKDSYILESNVPPYRNVKTGLTHGLVDAIMVIDPKCGNCTDPKIILDSIKTMGIHVESELKVNASSKKGKELSKKYNLTFAPSIILSREVEDYKAIKEILAGAGTFEKDGSYVLRNLDPSKVNMSKIK